jgi:hypothetical protein
MPSVPRRHWRPYGGDPPAADAAASNKTGTAHERGGAGKVNQGGCRKFDPARRTLRHTRRFGAVLRRGPELVLAPLLADKGWSALWQPSRR